MNFSASLGLRMVAAFIGIMVLAALVLVEPDADGARGAVIGAGLGLVNLAVGYLATRRSMRFGVKSALANLLGGFMARLLALVGLILLFQRTGSVDPTAFALTFLAFFFAYLGVEMMLVERSMDRTREAA